MAMRPPPGMLTRLQVSEILHCDKRSVARLDGDVLHPVRAEDGVTWLYPEAEVRALAASRSIAKATPPADISAPAPGRPPARTDGETYAAAFNILDADGQDIVQALCITAAKASEIEDAWAVRRDSMVIRGEDRKRLRARVPNVESFQDLLDALDNYARDTQILKEIVFICSVCRDWKPMTHEIWQNLRGRLPYMLHVCRECTTAP